MIEMAAPLCIICGRRTANYVCQDCGRGVCGNCFDPVHWLCSECKAKLRPGVVGSHATGSQFAIATWLFFIAFAIIFIGMLLMTIGSLPEVGNVSGGAVILIGPIPIILGTGPYSTALVVLALFITIVLLAFYLIVRRRA